MEKQAFSFGEKLKRLLQLHDVTQDEIAKLCGLQQATISTWIINKDINFYPKLIHVKRIADYFNITVDDLVSHEPIMENTEQGKYVDHQAKPVWLGSNTYEGWCLVDKKNRNFVGVNGYNLSFGEAKFEPVKCKQLAPTKLYEFKRQGKPLKLEEIKNLYIQSVIEEKPITVWVEVFDFGNNKNGWLNGRYQVKENWVVKCENDIYYHYANYGSRWIAYRE